MNNTEKFGLKIDNKLLNFIENEYVIPIYAHCSLNNNNSSLSNVQFDEP